MSNRISAAHAEHWINSHPSALRPLAQKIIDNIIHIDFEMFKSQLAECAKSLKLPRDYILVLPEEEDKSNPWVFSHALPYLSHLPFKVLKPSEIPAFLENQEEGRFDLLFVDDAAFSGTQTKCLVDTAASHFSGTHQVHIHFLIPFMTKRAHELLHRHQEAQFGAFSTIKGIAKLFFEHEKQILQDHNVNSTDQDVHNTSIGQS